MATELPIQVIPNNGQGLADVTFTAAAAEMFFTNDGTILLLMFLSGVGAGAVVVKATPATDSGRVVDVTHTTTNPNRSIAGPFKPRNWNNGNIVDLTIADIANLSLAAVRYGSG